VTWPKLNTERVISVTGRLPILQIVTASWVVSFEVTTFRYAFSRWTPSAEWLTFLAGVLTAIVTHSHLKRKTDTDHVVAVALAEQGKEPNGAATR
jgi:hypothetical protein